jgi:hypothetical protein
MSKKSIVDADDGKRKKILEISDFEKNSSYVPHFLYLYYFYWYCILFFFKPDLIKIFAG